jgi:hypothetical protein
MNNAALRASAILVLAVAAAAGCTSSGQPTTAPTPAGSSAAATPTPPSTAVPSVAFTGTAYFLGGTDRAVRIDAFSGGHVTKVVTLPADPTHCTYNTLRVSPDGKHIAWVKGGSSANLGKLMVADLDGSHAKTVDSDVMCTGATAIRWFNGSDTIDVVESSGSQGDFVAPDWQRSQSDPGDLADPVWSVDGNAYAAFNGANDDQLFTDSQQPSQNYQTAYQPPDADAANWDGYEPRSVSSDARYVAVGWIGTDPSRRDDSFAIVDATTSQPVTLPESSIAHAEFLGDQTLVVETSGSARRVDILDALFHIISSSPVPASLNGETLIRCVP